MELDIFEWHNKIRANPQLLIPAIESDIAHFEGDIIYHEGEIPFKTREGIKVY